MRHLDYEDIQAREAFDVHYERSKEMTAGDPDVTEAQLRHAALDYANTYSGGNVIPQPKAEP